MKETPILEVQPPVKIQVPGKKKGIFTSSVSSSKSQSKIKSNLAENKSEGIKSIHSEDDEIKWNFILCFLFFYHNLATLQE